MVRPFFSQILADAAVGELNSSICSARPAHIHRVIRVTDVTPRKPNHVEQLVAYLDGELNDEQSAEIEERLRKDAKLRQMTEDLDRTWGLLDVLEPVVAGEEFSRRTLKTITATGSVPLHRGLGTFGSVLSSIISRQALVWFGIGVMGTLCGLGVVALRGTSEESSHAEQLLRQIDVLQRYPEYSIIPDVNLLRQLRLPKPETSLSREAPR